MVAIFGQHRVKIVSACLFLLFLMSLSSPLQAAVPPSISLTTLDTPYTQNFDSLANSGTSSTTPDGWTFYESGTNANAVYSAGTGSSNGGDTYSFGNSGSTDRALGGLLSGSLTPTFGASFTNNTGAVITSLGISYIGEEWRLGYAGRSDRIDFQYSLNATSLTDGTWSDYNTLDFSTPDTGGPGAKNGNSSSERLSLTSTIPGLSIANGSTFWIRWLDYNASGADDGLAVDDFSLTPHGTYLPNLTVADVSKNEGNSGTTTFSFTVSLSTPAGTGGVTFDVATGDGTATAPTDYVAKTLTAQTIPAGSSDYTFDVLVNGDTTVEPNETLFVRVSNVAGANVGDIEGQGTIVTDDATKIHDIQGSGMTSSIQGQTVMIRGVVVGDYQGSGGLGGYYVQEEDADADGDPATSEGIWVYSSSSVSSGDLVQLLGTVTEYATSSGASNLTELGSVSNVTVVSSGNALPVAIPITLPVASVADLERYEGMLVTFPQQLTVTEVYDFGRYGEIDLALDRLWIPTNVANPGSAAIAREDLNARSRILLDDGLGSSNPYPAKVYPLTASNTVRVGYIVPANLTGVLDDRFGRYRLQPIGTVSFTPSNPRPATPANVGGNLKVAGLNMLNYFTTIDTTSGDTGPCGPTGGQDCRGADTDAEFIRQRTKLISAISSMSPDIAGLMEIENGVGDAAAQDLVNGLNAAAGAGTYAFISTGPIGTDAIRVGIIYKPGKVTPAGNYAVLTSAVNPLFVDTKNRPSLAQTFALNANGQKLTVVVNHLKSKGSCPITDPTLDPDQDQSDGQGCWNKTRQDAVTALTQWLASDPTHSGDPDYLVVGDMNAYAKEDPISAFTSAGYTNLVQSYLGTEGYSYVFDGETGYLDHALASASLASQVTGVTEWHINSDEPAALDYNSYNPAAYYADGPYRASDHDPVLVGLFRANTTTTIASSKNTAEVGQTIVFTATVSSASGTPTGTVTFSLDGTIWMTQALTAGQYSFSYSGLGVGTHSLQATYNGDANSLASTSNTITIQISNAKYYLPSVGSNYATAPNLIVQSITATSNNIQVVIKNAGNYAVQDDFWVDLYVNPTPAPTKVNQIWQTLSSQGAVWGVTGAGRAALVPGGTLTLTLGDDYYFPTLSKLTFPLGAGTKVYVQVDSANTGSSYGAVNELHEIAGGSYDNISSIAVTTGGVALPRITTSDPSRGSLPRRP